MIIKHFKKRYFAGETIDDVVKKAIELNNNGFHTTINPLGENFTDISDIDTYINECISLAQEIHNRSLSSHISIKPTALGLTTSYDDALQNISKILSITDKLPVFVRLDMEDIDYTYYTIGLFKELRKSYGNIGITLQCNLNRTFSDVLELPPNSDIRLCKGAYKGDVNEISFNLFECFVESICRGFRVSVATHNENLINKIIWSISYRGLDDDIEFQTLYGVKGNMASKLLSDGYRVRIYVPYGKNWKYYCWRRFKELISKGNINTIWNILIGSNK